MYFSKTTLSHILQLLQLRFTGEVRRLQSRPFIHREHLLHHLSKNASKTTRNLVRQERGQIPTPEIHELITSSSNCSGKRGRCYPKVTMTIAHFVHKIVKFLSSDICYVMYVCSAFAFTIFLAPSSPFHFTSILLFLSNTRLKTSKQAEWLKNNK